MPIDAFSKHFAELQDPRQTAKVAYPLFDVLFLTLCAGRFWDTHHFDWEGRFWDTHHFDRGVALCWT
ncbi:hypothetical protein WL1483_1615 [Aeromonas schubertii]|uniref:Uncharacterized protein n=1 Tax=Aeromonas schubertii TaxID=652 RepID=A0A0S2SH99_9GAMM|nr:hypothetical protein WL1483_1615 [Aeromonas schubertii]